MTALGCARRTFSKLHKQHRGMHAGIRDISHVWRRVEDEAGGMIGLIRVEAASEWQFQASPRLPSRSPALRASLDSPRSNVPKGPSALDPNAQEASAASQSFGSSCGPDVARRSRKDHVDATNP
jgi:hypothetical protein